MPITANQLKRATDAVTRRDDITRRDALFAQARDEGWTHQKIADATGLTRGRVGQILSPAAATTKDQT